MAAKAEKSGMDTAIAIAKDWMAGGTAAGISKTLVAPIGDSPRLIPLGFHGSGLARADVEPWVDGDFCASEPLFHVDSMYLLPDVCMFVWLQAGFCNA
jgi:hypothetical protein